MAFNILNFILGIWIIFSAPVLGFSSQPAAAWNNAIVGLAVMILALLRTTNGKAPSIINAILGLWLIVSPFALGFASLAAALSNNVILGSAICVNAVVANRRE